MNKAFISTLCSAFVIPGLGQILNEQIIKGAVILSVVFILFVGTLLKSYGIIRAVLKGASQQPLAPGVIIGRLKAEDFTALWCLLAIFGMVWLYSVVDAYVVGKKIDNRSRQGDLP